METQKFAQYSNPNAIGVGTIHRGLGSSLQSLDQNVSSGPFESISALGGACASPAPPMPTCRDLVDYTGSLLEQMDRVFDALSIRLHSVQDYSNLPLSGPEPVKDNVPADSGLRNALIDRNQHLDHLITRVHGLITRLVV